MIGRCEHRNHGFRASCIEMMTVLYYVYLSLCGHDFKHLCDRIAIAALLFFADALILTKKNLEYFEENLFINFVEGIYI